ncbi:MAG TPA: hypothetical protein VFO05_01895 [Candidatus Limnocylindrales bacterium]|nr:hypothetical protein [Candidatus Limnocylindrales bacterium]
MLIIESLRRDWKAVPALVRVGVVGLVLSGVADVVFHAVAPDLASHADAHTTAELAAHLAGLVSMIVIFLGVVTDGVRKSRTRRTSRGPEPKGAS